jgi:hypothetical protein
LYVDETDGFISLNVQVEITQSEHYKGLDGLKPTLSIYSIRITHIIIVIEFVKNVLRALQTVLLEVGRSIHQLASPVPIQEKV